MHCIGVIPARYGSNRLPGKPLALIQNTPLIQHVWERASKSDLLDDLIIATDDERIFDSVQAFGGKVSMTSSDLKSGTDRVAELIKDTDTDIVINIQGDEPFIEPSLIDDIIKSFDDPEVVMATPVRKSEPNDDIANNNVVKVVSDQKMNALNFSRSPIPQTKDLTGNKFWIHIGIYGYTREFLLKYPSLEQTPLELREDLEQLRALEHGYKIKLVETTYHSFPVDTEDDLERANKYFKENMSEKVDAA